MPDRNNKFVHDENMKDFRRKLDAETDPDKRKLLEQLLAEEADNKLSRIRATVRSHSGLAACRAAAPGGRSARGGVLGHE